MHVYIERKIQNIREQDEFLSSCLWFTFLIEFKLEELFLDSSQPSPPPPTLPAQGICRTVRQKGTCRTDRHKKHVRLTGIRNMSDGQA